MTQAVDKAVTVLAAIATPVLGLLVDQHVITPLTSLDIGSILAAAVGAYHGGKVVQKRSEAPSPVVSSVVNK